MPTYSRRARGEQDLCGNAVDIVAGQLSGTLRAVKLLVKQGFGASVFYMLRTTSGAPQEAGLGNLETT